jgi:glycosyltransferase involved in cell wall biosynthesis
MSGPTECTRPLRILMTTDTIGGVWTYTVTLLRAVQGTGIDIVLATMGAPLRPDQRRMLADLPHVVVVESDYRLEWMAAAWDDVKRAGRWLLELQTRYRPHLVHLNGYAHAALAWKVPVLVVGHSCVLSWWEAVRGEPAPATWRDYAEAVTRGLRRADAVVTPSHAMLDALLRHYRPPTRPTQRRRVIPNGCALDRYRPGEKAPIILSAGRLWDAAKNLETLDCAAEGLSWPVYVAGDTRHPDGGRVSPHHVKPIGLRPADELAEWLGQAWIYALPALYEPFGLSVLEAAASGAVLVLGDIPSLREIWADAALYVAPRDHQALATTLQSLIDDPAVRHDYSARALRRSRGLSDAAMAERYVDLYRELLADRGQPDQGRRRGAALAISQSTSA